MNATIQRYQACRYPVFDADYRHDQWAAISRWGTERVYRSAGFTIPDKDLPGGAQPVCLPAVRIPGTAAVRVFTQISFRRNRQCTCGFRGIWRRSQDGLSVQCRSATLFRAERYRHGEGRGRVGRLLAMCTSRYSLFARQILYLPSRR